MPWRVKTASQSVFTAITRETLERDIEAGKLFTVLNNGTWRRIRANGQLQTWKRDKNRFRKPFKYGLKDYGAIDDGHIISGQSYLNPDLFRHEDDLTEEKE